MQIKITNLQTPPSDLHIKIVEGSIFMDICLSIKYLNKIRFMKKTNSNRNYKCPANIMAVSINAALVLIVPSNDLIDWLFRIVELLAFIKIGMTSWKWRISNAGPIFLNRDKV